MGNLSQLSAHKSRQNASFYMHKSLNSWYYFQVDAIQNIANERAYAFRLVSIFLGTLFEITKGEVSVKVSFNARPRGQKKRLYVLAASSALATTTICSAFAPMSATASPQYTVGPVGLTSDTVTLTPTTKSALSGDITLDVNKSGLDVSYHLSGLQPGKSYDAGLFQGMLPKQGSLSQWLPKFTATREGTWDGSAVLSGVQAIPENGWYISLAQVKSNGTPNILANANIGVPLPSNVGVATVWTKKYLISVQIGPLATMITKAQAKAGMKGEIMVSSPGVSMPMMASHFDGHAVNHHLEVHIFNRQTGTVAMNLTPKVDVLLNGKTLSVPAVAMYGQRLNTADYHYGNNVYLPSGSASIRISIGSETVDVKGITVYNAPASPATVKMLPHIAHVSVSGKTFEMPVLTSATSNGAATDVPLWYIMQALETLHIRSTWHDGQWNFPSIQPQTMSMSSSMSMPMSGNVSVSFDGKVIETMEGTIAVDPFSKHKTTFVSLESLQNLLGVAGLQCNVSGSDWTIVPAQK